LPCLHGLRRGRAGFRTMVMIGQYVPGDSVVHRLDPRVKILSVIGLSIMILSGTVLTGAVVGFFLVSLIPLSRLSLRPVARALRPIWVFVLILFLLHLLFTKGRPIPPLGPWPVTVTYEGLFRGLGVAWEFILLVMSASILTMTTSPTELVSGIERLLRPLKAIGISSHDVAIMISIALRFVPLLLEEMKRIKEAQTARGAVFESGPLLGRARAATSLMVPVIMGSMRKADDLVTAMEGRAYRRGPRTTLRELRLSGPDYGALAVMILITAVYGLERYSLGAGGFPLLS